MHVELGQEFVPQAERESGCDAAQDANVMSFPGLDCAFREVLSMFPLGDKFVKHALRKNHFFVLVQALVVKDMLLRFYADEE